MSQQGPETAPDASKRPESGRGPRRGTRPAVLRRRDRCAARGRARGRADAGLQPVRHGLQVVRQVVLILGRRRPGGRHHRLLHRRHRIEVLRQSHPEPVRPHRQPEPGDGLPGRLLRADGPGDVAIELPGTRFQAGQAVGPRIRLRPRPRGVLLLCLSRLVLPGDFWTSHKSASGVWHFPIWPFQAVLVLGFLFLGVAFMFTVARDITDCRLGRGKFAPKAEGRA